MKIVISGEIWLVDSVLNELKIEDGSVFGLSKNNRESEITREYEANHQDE